jgi:hypothetical protein
MGERIISDRAPVVHNFTFTSFAKPTYCTGYVVFHPPSSFHHLCSSPLIFLRCTEFIWGIYKQGLRCSGPCKGCYHERCLFRASAIPCAVNHALMKTTDEDEGNQQDEMDSILLDRLISVGSSLEAVQKPPR